MPKERCVGFSRLADNVTSDFLKILQSLLYFLHASDCGRLVL